MSFTSERGNISEEQRWAALKGNVVRALVKRPHEALLGCWLGTNIKSPGMLLTWSQAADSHFGAGRGLDQVFIRVVYYIGELINSDSVSDGWLANRIVCRLLAHEHRAPAGQIQKLTKLQQILHEKTRNATLADIAEAADRAREIGF